MRICIWSKAHTVFFLFFYRATVRTQKSDRHIVRGALRSADSPLVIDLGGSDVPMTEQVLDFSDIDSSIECVFRRNVKAEFEL